MVAFSRLLQLTLWVAAVDAFYPWFPNDCHDDCDSVGPGSKRGAESQTDSPAKGITLGLVQRVPTSDDSASMRSARAVRAASRLAAKYAASSKDALSSRTESKLRARANEFKVLAPAPPTAKNTAGIYQDGADYSYFIQVRYGSSAKAMYMLLDSGAGTSWLMGPDCKSEACQKHNSFGPEDSTTLKRTEQPFAVLYGTGSVSGIVARDIVQVAGMEEEMSFGIANETSNDFTHFAFDGILGLAMGKPGDMDNFMDVLTKGEKLGSNLFAVSLSRYTEATNTGTITFGAIDPSKHTGDISYTSVGQNKDGYWAIPVDDMGFDGKAAGIKGRHAYIDTGTSFAFGPEKDVEALHKLIPGATTENKVTYKVPCGTDKPVTVTFSGVSYTISPKDWVSGSGDDCTSNFYGKEVMEGSWLLGDIFLKNVYAVFDASNTRIGFAEKPIPPAKTTTSTTTDASGATITAIPSGPRPVPPAIGLSGSGEQDGGSGTAAPETAGSAPTSKSLGSRLEMNGKFISILGLVAAAVVLMA